MQAFAESLSVTPLSFFIQQELWVIPWLQIVHIVALALVFGSVFMIDARILGLTGRSQTMTQTARRFIPWVWIGTVVLAISGSLLIIGEPVRSLLNPFFWIKMTLLAIALISTAAFQTSLNRNPAFWEEDHAWRGYIRILAVVALLVWCGIIVAGRFIAYIENFAVY